jgi:hypothetical protein
LTASSLQVWLTGNDPVTGQERGRQRLSPDADLVLDGTVNAPKSFSVAAILHPDLAEEFEALQDRLRDRIILTWQRELNARRGHNGLERMGIARLEVVELQHRRSRALDPHVHRHLWLNVKVQGDDGRWSNVDSRVAMRLQTLINAEGELAGRTDPEWVAALARHGYTLDQDGEVAELVHVVRPLSRRSNQIESNRAQLIAQWRDANPGLSPSSRVLVQIDRQAWALSRPNKPARLDEEEWGAEIRSELAAIDPHLFAGRRTQRTVTVRPELLDLELLAATAVADADGRSTSSAGRFSLVDLRAGAMRAIAASGVTAPRADLDPLIRDVTNRAAGMTVTMLPGRQSVPDHVKCLMAAGTVRGKIRLAGLLDALAIPGASAGVEVIGRASAQAAPEVKVAAEQQHAAAVMAGTHGLVTVTGPAGTGKTTLLRVAQAALVARGARMILVAPTKKAASVAGREIGTESSSLHALLFDYGYRWRTTKAGTTEWARLSPDDPDPVTGGTYRGVQRLPLRAGDRIVVDEAGMLELHAASALMDLAVQHGAGVALIGDPRQALPVGHSGAMAAASRRANASVELETVHRFADPAYAALTLRMRDPKTVSDAMAVVRDLQRAGHVLRVSSADAARAALVDEYVAATRRRHSVTVVVGSNAEVRAVNDGIQQHRMDTGQLDPTRLAFGAEEQRILIGDVVQTRRNDRTTGVENRAIWIVRAIHPDSIDLTAVNDSGDVRRVHRHYAAEHLHLAYATTVHGIQGETVDESIVGPGVDAAGLYVGLTRGRLQNIAVVVAGTDDRARDDLAATITRAAPETTIGDAVRAARRDADRSANVLTLPTQDTRSAFGF